MQVMEDLSSSYSSTLALFNASAPDYHKGLRGSNHHPGSDLEQGAPWPAVQVPEYLRSTQTSTSTLSTRKHTSQAQRVPKDPTSAQTNTPALPICVEPSKLHGYLRIKAPHSPAQYTGRILWEYAPISCTEPGDETNQPSTAL